MLPDVVRTGAALHPGEEKATPPHSSAPGSELILLFVAGDLCSCSPKGKVWVYNKLKISLCLRQRREPGEGRQLKSTWCSLGKHGSLILGINILYTCSKYTQALEDRPVNGTVLEEQDTAASAVH